MLFKAVIVLIGGKSRAGKGKQEYDQRVNHAVIKTAFTGKQNVDHCRAVNQSQ